MLALQVTPTHAGTASASKVGSASVPTDVSGTTDESISAVIAPRVLTGSTDLERVEVPLPVEVSGIIRANDTPVPSRIKFIPKNNNFGLQGSEVSTTTTGEPVNSSLGVPYDFITQVLQNIAYTVMVEPLEKSDTSLVSSSRLPPFYGEFTATKIESNRYELIYDGFYTTMERKEFVLRGAPTGLRLKAKAVSDANNDTAVSTVFSFTVVEPETRFWLVFSTPPGAYRLVIEPDTPGISTSNAYNNSEIAPYPSFRITQSELKDPNSENVIEVTLPSDPPKVLFSGTVSLCGGSTGSGKESLPMSLYSSELPDLDRQSGATGYYNITSAKAEYNASDKQFEFAIEVFPGKYQVVVSPPDFKCGRFARTLQIPAQTSAEAAAPVVIALPSPAYIEGKLQTADGEPVIGGTVYAEALGREGIDLADLTSLTAYNRSNHATTDEKEKGTFRIPVDLGSYDLIAKPPAGSGFAWQVFHDVNIGNRITFYRDIEIGRPISISGQLVYATSGSAKSALKGATIRAFGIIVDDNDKIPTRAIEVATTTADEKNAFQLLVSSAMNEGLY
jgi:hypothetical protein